MDWLANLMSRSSADLDGRAKTGWMGVIVGGSGWGDAGAIPPGEGSRGDWGLFKLLTSINGRGWLGECWRPTGEAAGLGGLMLRAETGAA